MQLQSLLAGNQMFGVAFLQMGPVGPYNVVFATLIVLQTLEFNTPNFNFHLL